MKPSWVYILRCADNSYYTGCTTELTQRVAQHQDGSIEGYTSSRRPVTLVFSQEFSDINDAIRAERQIKGWTRKKKEALMNGDFNLLRELAKCKNQTHHLNQSHGESFDGAQDKLRRTKPSAEASSPFDSAQGDDKLCWLNRLEEQVAHEELSRCCGSSNWVQQMAAHRPFGSNEELFRIADETWWSLSESDWKEAFTHHPQIGDIENLRKKFTATAAWASNEQLGTNNAREGTLTGLAEGNQQYEEKFGYIFIVCATGKNAEEMLTIVQSRLRNFPDEEIRIAADEQAKITKLRLDKLLNTA